jgi:hypothetical protein
MVTCLPTGTDNLKKSFLIYAAGGPAASFLLTWFAFLLFKILIQAKLMQCQMVSRM